MAGAVVIEDRQHQLSQTLDIPRSNVTVIIGTNAVLATLSDE